MSRVVSGTRTSRVVAFSIAALVAAAGVDALADLTQNRPDPRPSPGARGMVVLDVVTRDGDEHDSAAETLWHACRGTLDYQAVPSFIDAGTGGLPNSKRYRILMDHVAGEHEGKRFRGCLEDAIADRIQARVVTIGPARTL